MTAVHIAHEDRRWLVAATPELTEITDLHAVKATATRTLTGASHDAFTAQFDAAHPADRADLIVEWYHS